MLTNEWMGAFCLGVVWLNTLLIAAHVWQAQRALAKERAALGTVVEGKVVDAGGASSLAEVRVAQLGRAITTGGPARILFTEASRASSAYAGTIECAGERIAVEPAGDPVRVWSTAGQGVRAESDFEEAYRAASTNRGHPSHLTLSIGAVGSTVWLAGVRDGAAMRVRLVADRDPRATLASGRARALGFIAASLAILGLVTALALVRPWFSGWSTLGGVLAVAYFLAVQPIAVALREAIAPPEQRRIGGLWQR